MKAQGVRVSLIAKILKAEGRAKSLAYYHLSDNRDAYCNQVKKTKAFQRQRIQERIHLLIEEGYTTGMISVEWNVPLALINRIYVKT